MDEYVSIRDPRIFPGTDTEEHHVIVLDWCAFGIRVGLTLSNKFVVGIFLFSGNEVPQDYLRKSWDAILKSKGFKTKDVHSIEFFIYRFELAASRNLEASSKLCTSKATIVTICNDANFHVFPLGFHGNSHGDSLVEGR